MRIRLVSLLFLSASLLSVPAFSLTKKELDKKYAYAQTAKWDQSLPKKVLYYLDQGKFQEAIWELEDDDREAEAQPIKDFLRNILENGEIEADGIISLGGGATDTKLIYLPHGIRAVLKMKSMNPASSYTSEVAAYEIDQLGKFALVPMTVLRKHDKSVASLQYFVDGAIDADRAPDYVKSPKLNIFDYLIRNRDRTVHNVMIANAREVAIDHGHSLRPGSFIGEILRFTDKTKLAVGIAGDRLRMNFVFPKENPEEFRAEARIIDALKNLTWSQMTLKLHPLLDMNTVTMVWKKKIKLLKALNENKS